jgi:small GTP-binding protein
MEKKRKAPTRLPALKVVIVGEASVGKTNLLKHLLHEPFSAAQRATEHYDRYDRFVQVGQTIVRIDLWDTAGQERHRSLAPTFYRGARLAIIVYDITSRPTFSEVQWWYDEYLRQSQLEEDDGPGAVLLVGEKNDLEHLREVRKEEGLRIAAQWTQPVAGQTTHSWNRRVATEHSSLASTGEMSDVLRRMMNMVADIDRHLKDKYRDGHVQVRFSAPNSGSGAGPRHRPTLEEATAALTKQAARTQEEEEEEEARRLSAQARRRPHPTMVVNGEDPEQGELEKAVEDCSC